MVNSCKPAELPLKVKITHPTLTKRTFYALNLTLLAVLELHQLEEDFAQLPREDSVMHLQLLTTKLLLTTSCRPLVPQMSWEKTYV